MAFTKIKEYSNTDDGVARTLLVPKLIMPTLIEAVEKTLLPREISAMVLSGFQGSSIDVNLETPDSVNVRSVAEGAEIPIDALEFTNVTFTPLKYGTAVRITREMMEDAQFELLQRNISAVGEKLAENENKLIVTQLDLAGATTTGGAAITIANITESMQDLEDNDYTPTDFLVGTEVLNDLRNIDTFVEADKAGNTEMLMRGFLGTIFGMNVVRLPATTAALPSATNRKYAYVLDRSQAYGIAIKRDITVENFDMPSFDMQGAAITQRIDVKLLRSAAVSRITTT